MEYSIIQQMKSEFRNTNTNRSMFPNTDRFEGRQEIEMKSSGQYLKYLLCLIQKYNTVIGRELLKQIVPLSSNLSLGLDVKLKPKS